MVQGVDTTERLPARSIIRSWGQSLTELALLIPFLVLLLLSMVEVTWWMRAYVVTGMAAREGARYGSRGPHLTGDVDEKALQIATLTADSMSGLLGIDYPTANPNVAIFVTLIEIDKSGDTKQLTTSPNVKLGSLSDVSSRVCLVAPCADGTLDVSEIANDNKSFSAAFCAEEEQCNNDIVVVEVFYNHSPIVFRLDFLPEQLLTYSRSIMRVVADKPDATSTP